MPSLIIVPTQRFITTFDYKDLLKWNTGLLPSNKIIDTGLVELNAGYWMKPLLKLNDSYVHINWN